MSVRQKAILFATLICAAISAGMGKTAQMVDSMFHVDVPHDAEISAMAASDDLVMTGDNAGILKIWRATDGSPVTEYRIEDDLGVSAIAVTANRPAAAAVVTGNRVFEMDLVSGEKIWEILGGPGFSGRSFATYSPDGRFLAHNGPGLRIIDTWAQEEYVTLSTAASGAAFVDATTIVYIDDAGLRFLDLRDGKTIRLIAIDETDIGKPIELGFSSERRSIFVLHRDGFVAYDLDSGNQTARQFTDIADDHMAVAPHSAMVVSSRWNGSFLGNAVNLVTVYQGDGYQDIVKVQGSTARVTKLMMHQGIIYVGQRDGTIRRWTTRGEHDNAPLEYLPELGQVAGGITAIATSEDGRFLALGNSDGGVDIFDVWANVRREVDPNGVRPVPPAPNFGTTGTSGFSTTIRVGVVDFPPISELQFEPGTYFLRTVTEGDNVALIDATTATIQGQHDWEDNQHLDTPLRPRPGGGWIATIRDAVVTWAPGEVTPTIVPIQNGEDVAFHKDIAINTATKESMILTRVRTNPEPTSVRFLDNKFAPIDGRGMQAQACLLSLPIGRVLTVLDDQIRILDQAGALISSVPHGSSYLSVPKCHAADGLAIITDSTERVIVAFFDDNGLFYDLFAITTSFPILSASVSHDNAFVFLGGPNGQLALVDTSTGRETWRLTSGPEGWVFLGDELFDAPQQSWQDVVIANPDDARHVFSTGDVLSTGLTSGLLGKVLRDEPLPEVGSLPNRVAFPPRVTIISPDPTLEFSANLGGSGGKVRQPSGIEYEMLRIGEPMNTVSASEALSNSARQTITVKVLVEDQGAGVGECRLQRNRQTVHSFPAPSLSAQQHELQAVISLGLGRTELSVYCLSSEGTAGNPHRIVLQTAEERQNVGTAYVIGIGIEDYIDDNLDLLYAQDDAQLFVNVLSERVTSSGRYANHVPVLLANVDAHWDRIDALFRILSGKNVTPEEQAMFPDVAPTTADDAVFLFIAAHGEVHEGGYEILLYDHNDAQRSVIGDGQLQTLFRDVSASDLMLVIDACHSQAALTDPENRRVGPFNINSFAQLVYEKGLFFLAAAAEEDLALEVTKYGHGLLSHALLSTGLTHGHADRNPADGVITAQEFIEFPTIEVPLLHVALQTEELPSQGSALALLRGGSIGPSSEDLSFVQTPSSHVPGYGFNSAFVLSRTAK